MSDDLLRMLREGDIEGALRRGEASQRRLDALVQQKKEHEDIMSAVEKAKQVQQNLITELIRLNEIKASEEGVRLKARAAEWTQNATKIAKEVQQREKSVMALLIEIDRGRQVVSDIADFHKRQKEAEVQLLEEEKLREEARLREASRLLQEKKKQLEEEALREEERLKTAFIENANSLDSEIVKADSIVASLFDELNEIETREQAAENDCARYIREAESDSARNTRTAENELAGEIRSSNAKLADHKAKLEGQIAERVAAISFDEALRNQILALQEQKKQIDTEVEYWEQEVENKSKIISKKTNSLSDKWTKDSDFSTWAYSNALPIAGSGGTITGIIGSVIDCWTSEEIWRQGCASLFVVPITFVIVAAIYGVGAFVLVGAISLLIILGMRSRIKNQITEAERRKQDASAYHQRSLERKHSIEQSIENCIRQGEEQLRQIAEPSIAAAKQQTETYQRSRREEKQQKLRRYEEDTQRTIQVYREQKQQKLAELKQERRQVTERFAENWRSAVERLNVLVTRIQCSQPQLTALTPEVLNTSETLPETLVSGLANVSFPFNAHKIFTRDWQKSVPNLIDFPFSKPVFDKYLEEYKNAADASPLHRLLLRMLYALPVGTLEIISIDPKQMGNSLAPFKPLTGCQEIVPHERFIARQDEIESTLKELSVYLEDLIQKHFHAVPDWKSYNEKYPDNKLPYKLLFIFGFPEQFSGKSISYLKSIVEHGLQHGILPIITVDYSTVNSLSQHEGKQVKEIVSMLEKNGQKIDKLNSVERFRLQKLSITQENEPFPEHNDLIQCLEQVKNAYQQHREGKKFSATIEDMWQESAFGKATSERELSAALGWNDEGQEVAIKFGDKSAHALLAGTTGSGKSNLLHVLIHGLLHNYTAKELNLYILTLKGNEFNIYNKYALPQIKLVTMAPAEGGVTEYGVKVLDFIEKTMRERQVKGGGDGYAALEKTTGERPPRILVIIDEFQELYREERDAPDKINNILKLARSAGIHILLATQTLSNVKNDMANISVSALMANIPCKVALKINSPMDSDTMLGNNRATTLISQKEAIIKDEDGESKLNVPQAKGENKDTGKDFDKICDEHLRFVFEQSQKSGFTADTIFFNATELPKHDKQIFGKYPNQIVIGEELDIHKQPLAFEWERRTGNNLCVAGINDKIQQGILHSVLYSVQQGNHFDKVIYYNTFPNSGIALPPFATAEVKDHTWDCGIAELTSNLQNQRTLLIIDTIDGADLFHPKQKKYGDTTVTPADMLKTLLEEGPRRGSFVLVFIENWRRFNTVCKDYVSNFELRIGFCLDKNDAGNLATGNYEPLKGLDIPNKAIFVNRLRNVQTIFRPFIVPTDGK